MLQSGKINLIVIAIVLVVALGASAFIMFKFVLNKEEGDEEPVAEPPCEKIYLELAEFQEMAINPAGPQRAIVQMSLLFEYCLDDKKVPIEMEKFLLLLKADINYYLQSQTLDNFRVENRPQMEEELRVLVNNNFVEVEKGLTAVRVTSLVIQYM
ncbi:MAG: hypothetical protein K8R90_03745 [Candidatus Cloacimonetes bacterium]|nr:hypothetical protein [Candidatus Cloacimonadota bacterium]